MSDFWRFLGFLKPKYLDYSKTHFYIPVADPGATTTIQLYIKWPTEHEVHK